MNWPVILDHIDLCDPGIIGSKLDIKLVED
jgi:hypothetical protein